MNRLPIVTLSPAGTHQVASARLRCHVLARELARLGCEVRIGLDSQAPLPDVLYVQKLVTPEILVQARAVRAAGGHVVYDIDDWGAALGNLCGDEATFAQFLSLCDAVSVDTAVRQDVLAHDERFVQVPQFWVVPDPIDYVDVQTEVSASRDAAGLPVHGCWFGNGPNIKPAIPHIQAAVLTGRLGRFSVITNAALVPQLQTAWPALSVEAWQLDTFAARLRDHDFCLLIHDSDTEGVQKSNNKMLAALGQGVVPLVSNTPAYAETAERIGIPDLVIAGPQDLADRLQPGRLQRLREQVQGDRCRRVLREFMPANVARLFLDKILQLHGESAATSAVTAPPVGAPAIGAPPKTRAEHLSELVESWQQSPHPTAKISSYFPSYVQLFSHLRGTACTFIETGVLDGGSLFMWRRWLGERARIIGIDLNPAATRWRDAGFEIFIGDQGDPAFWRDTLGQIGRFDVLLDDGGHQSFQQIVTVQEALRGRRDPCLIVVEDTAASFMRDFARHGPHSFLEYAKDSTDLLTGRSFGMYPGRFPADHNREAIDAFAAVSSVQFFNGIVAFQVDGDSAVAPRLLQNKPPGAATDFRYEGRESAAVAWPNVLRSETVTVHGGPAKPAAVRLPVDGPVRLNLGCGDMPLPGYVNVDVAVERAGKQPDVCCDIRDLSVFPDGCADEIMAIHVIEHFYRWEVVDLLKEWVRVLKPGGRLVLECPNLITACETVLKDPDTASRPDQAGNRSMWCLYGDPGWQDPLMCHRWLYTPQSLAQVMAEAGLGQLAQTPPMFKARHPRDMRIEGVKA